MSSNRYDVIVVGGGPSGFMAAVSAAREGLRTLLIEKYGFLGGMATAGLVGSISSFFYEDERVIRGLPQEFVDRLVRCGGATGHMRSLNSWGIGYYSCFYDREQYKFISQEMVLEAGADILLHSFFLILF